MRQVPKPLCIDTHVAQVLTDRREVVDNRNLKLLQVFGRTYTRQLEDLRRAHDTGRQDDLALRANDDFGTVARLRKDDADGGRCATFLSEEHPFGRAVHRDLEIRPS